jgi:large subunit ribosomal protein L15
MKLHELKPAAGARKQRKRVGRGAGSGYGKTAGRGTKGTKARTNVKPFFEGGQMPFVRRVPKLKGFKPPERKRFGSVNVGALARAEGSQIGPDELRAAGLIRKRDRLVKILGDGEVDRAVTVRAHAFSDSARAKIEAAGGAVEVLDSGTGSEGRR